MYCIGNASQAKLRDRVAKRRPSLVRFECRRCCSEIMFHTQHNGYLPSASSPSCKWWVPWWALSVCPIRINVQTSGPKVGSDMLSFPQAIVTQGEDELMRVNKNNMRRSKVQYDGSIHINPHTIVTETETMTRNLCECGEPITFCPTMYAGILTNHMPEVLLVYMSCKGYCWQEVFESSPQSSEPNEDQEPAFCSADYWLHSLVPRFPLYVIY